MIKKISVILSALMLIGASIVNAIDISARSAIVISEDDELLFEKSAEAKMPMASTTKIMTAICTIENINTNIPIKVSSDAAGVEGSSVYLKAGEIMSVKELLYAMMLNSGNDAATALAIAVSGNVESFCSLMNKTAAKIGAKNTQFKNPSGLYDDNHYTTACDLAKITAYAMKNPLFKKIVSTKSIRISGSEKNEYRQLKNHNRLLGDLDGCIGVKTGFTKKCGRCLVSAIEKNNKIYIAVTLNAPDDWRDHRAMYEAIN